MKFHRHVNPGYTDWAVWTARWVIRLTWWRSPPCVYHGINLEWWRR